MKRPFFILLILFCAFNSYAQKINKNDENTLIKSVVYEYFYFKDPNPSHQGEFSICYHALNSALTQKCNTDSLRSELLTLLYENSVLGDEDVIDGVRWSIRLTTIFTAIALVSDEYRYPTFLFYADQTISELSDEWMPYAILIELVRIIKITEFYGTNSPEIKTVYNTIKGYIKKYKEIKPIHDTKFISDIEALISY